MFWKIEADERGTATTLGQARAQLLEDGTWGLNEMAVEAINGVALGLRQGWCLHVDVAGDDEVLFLRAMDDVAAAMEPLGLHAEPGFFINRRKTSVRNIVQPGLPFTTRVRFKDWPVEFVHRAVIAISCSPEVASAMLDCYAIAVAGRGRFFDRRAWQPPSNVREEMAKLAAMLGVPQAVIEHRMEHVPQGMLMTLNNAHQLEAVHDVPDWTSELFWAFETGFDDPFDDGNASISREHAIHAMTVLEAGPRWTPEGWDDVHRTADEEVRP